MQEVTKPHNTILGGLIKARYGIMDLAIFALVVFAVVWFWATRTGRHTKRHTEHSLHQRTRQSTPRQRSE